MLFFSYTLKTDKQDLSTPTITIEKNTGKLQFTNYYLYPSIVYILPFTIIYRITITASNSAGSASYNLTVAIQMNINHKRGLYFNITSKEAFTCLNGPESAKSYESQPEYTGIIDNIDSLNSQNGFLIRFPFIKTNFIKYFEINFSGLFYASTCGYYTFYSQADQGTKMSLDGKEIIYNYQICDGYEHMYKKLVYLTQGYHQIEISYYKGSESTDWKFSYSYTLPNSVEQLPLPLYHIESEIDPVIKLTFSKQHYTLFKNLFYKIPFLFEQGDANRCYTYPNLPVGLYIHDNSIMGVALEVLKKTKFGIMCENSNSITNMVHFTLEVIEDKKLLEKGAKLTISKPISTNNFLTSDNKNNMNLYYTFQLQEVIIPTTPPWYDISSEFTTNFIVTIHSYIYVPKDGNYIIKLKTSSYVFLYINNMLYILHNTKSDIEEYTTISLKCDYYYFELIFNHDNGETSLELEWKHEEEDEYRNIYDYIYSIFILLFYFIDSVSGDLYYKYYLYTYTVNEVIASPNQIINKPSEYNSFTVNPQLPDGIIIDSNNGDISGMPTTYQNEFIRFFTVTAKNTGNDKSIDIPIAISLHSIIYIYLYYI